MPFLSSPPSHRHTASSTNADAATRLPCNLAAHGANNSTKRAVALSVGLTLAGLSAAACGIPASHAETIRTQNHTTPSHNAESVRCEVELEALRGGTHIAARVTADHAVSGTYEMALTNRAFGGRSTLRQSGEFQAGPNASTILSESRMPGRPTDQNVTLTLRIHGQTLTCGETIL